jgi:hypothetical protein
MLNKTRGEDAQTASICSDCEDLSNTRLVYNVSTADLPASTSSTTHINLTAYVIRVFVGSVTFMIKYKQL